VACALILTISLLNQAQAQGSLDEELDLARQLNATSHWRSGRSILEQIEPELARASASQRDRYDLILAHNLALGGAPAAGLELIEQVLARRLEPTLNMHALWLAANLATAERSYARAFSYIKTGMEMLARVDDSAARAGLLGMAGRLYAEAGEVERGVELARQAMDYASRVPPDHPYSSRCVAGQRLTAALEMSDAIGANLQAAADALEHCQREQNGHFTAALESLIGELHLQKGNLSESERWLRQALARQTAIGHLTGLMLTELRMMDLKLRLGEPMPEAVLIDQLVSHFRARRYWDRKARTHQLVARFAERDQDFSTAIEHLQRESVARERFAARQRSRRTAYLEVQYDLDTSRRELALLQEQARVTELEKTTTRQQTTLRRSAQLGAGLLVALLAIGLIRAARERRHFENLSRQDGLTELLNHTSFFEAADRALNRCIGEGQPFTLAVGDIDHFKQINDKHGHLAGDTVLQRIASRMRAEFPKAAILGRVGGEEFAIACPCQALNSTRDRVENLRQRINTTRSDDQEVQASISFGVAEFDGSETIEQLRKRADECLYQAKQTGRDRVVVADDP